VLVSTRGLEDKRGVVSNVGLNTKAARRNSVV
jgi:hypothetical protein